MKCISLRLSANLIIALFSCLHMYTAIPALLAFASSSKVHYRKGSAKVQFTVRLSHLTSFQFWDCRASMTCDGGSSTEQTGPLFCPQMLAVCSVHCQQEANCI